MTKNEYEQYQSLKHNLISSCSDFAYKFGDYILQIDRYKSTRPDLETQGKAYYYKFKHIDADNDVCFEWYETWSRGGYDYHHFYFPVAAIWDENIGREFVAKAEALRIKYESKILRTSFDNKRWIEKEKRATYEKLKKEFENGN